MVGGKLAKDVHHLQRDIQSLFQGQARVTEVDDNLEYIQLDITPSEGPYAGACIKFRVIFDEDCYTTGHAPTVVCQDYIYHPNIDPTVRDELDTNVCVSLLDEWDTELGLDHLVMAILFLMYNPNPSDALSPLFDGSEDPDDPVFLDTVKRTLQGKSHDGYDFACLWINKNEIEDDVVNDNVVDENKNGENNGGVTVSESEVNEIGERMMIASGANVESGAVNDECDVTNADVNGESENGEKITASTANTGVDTNNATAGDETTTYGHTTCANPSASTNDNQTVNTVGEHENSGDTSLFAGVDGVDNHDTDTTTKSFKSANVSRQNSAVINCTNFNCDRVVKGWGIRDVFKSCLAFIVQRRDFGWDSAVDRESEVD